MKFKCYYCEEPGPFRMSKFCPLCKGTKEVDWIDNIFGLNELKEYYLFKERDPCTYVSKFFNNEEAINHAKIYGFESVRNEKSREIWHIIWEKIPERLEL